METKYRIYKITCLVNDKIYIGYTKNTPKQRLSQHFRSAKQYSLKNNKFANAILKYGKSNFIIETIIELDNEKDALLREIDEIKLHNSIKAGYNTSAGGQGSKKDNRYKDISGEKNPMFGKSNKHKAETIESIRTSVLAFNSSPAALNAKKNRQNKMTELNKTKEFKDLNNKKKKPILQIDLISNNIIREWDSARDAANSLNLFSNSITKACKGKLKSTGNFKWCYK